MPDDFTRRRETPQEWKVKKLSPLNKWWRAAEIITGKEVCGFISYVQSA